MKNQKQIQIQHEVLASFLPVSFQEVEADSRSALQAVLESDMEREVLLKEEEMLTANRVGKCHGYDGYIRVKKLASWGKKFGRPK